ncbi:MAG: glutathione S-transferase [Arenicella sp.]|jgi:glutathione S-transferase
MLASLTLALLVICRTATASNPRSANISSAVSNITSLLSLPFLYVIFRKEDQLNSDYLEINPNGVVPTLLHDGEVIVDSSCILEYLEDAFPETPLSPTDAVGKAKMRAWLRFMEEVPTSAIRTPSFEQIFLPTLRLVGGKKSFDKASDKRTLRKGFYKKMNSGSGFSEREIENSTSQLASTVARMNTALSQHPWLLGDKLSLVDISLAPLIDRMQDLGLGYLWKNHPNVDRWLSSIQLMPSFQEAFYKGSRLSQRFEFKLAMRSARKQNRVNSGKGT